MFTLFRPFSVSRRVDDILLADIGVTKPLLFVFTGTSTFFIFHVFVFTNVDMHYFAVVGNCTILKQTIKTTGCRNLSQTNYFVNLTTSSSLRVG